MARKFISDGHCEGAKELAKQMNEIARRFEALGNSEIEDRIHDEHEKAFPNKPKRTHGFVKKEDSKFYSYEKIQAYEEYLKTPEGKEEMKASKTLYRRIEKAVQKERESLYLHLGKNVRSFWD
jgi:glutamate synthase domain-containing protein 2